MRVVYKCYSTREASLAHLWPPLAPAGSLKSWPMAETTALGEGAREANLPTSGRPKESKPEGPQFR